MIDIDQIVEQLSADDNIYEWEDDLQTLIVKLLEPCLKAGIDSREVEGHLRALVDRALCEAAGIRVWTVPPPKLIWRLHCLDALQEATISYFEGDFCADIAWPEKRIALVADFAIGDSDLPELDIAYVKHWQARDRYFDRNGWLVLRVDPDSPTLDDQLARVAAFVRAIQSDRVS